MRISNLEELFSKEKVLTAEHPLVKGIRTTPFENDDTVILKAESFDSKKIVPYQSEAKTKILFEPSTFYEYIGQDQAKDQISTAINIIKELRPVHILINGWAGCGKTTLAKITANMLNANFIYRIPEQLEDPNELLNTLNIINSTERLTVLMIDEIHNIKNSPKTVNRLLTILENFVCDNMPIKPFVMIGATTDLDMLMKRNSPLVSRFYERVYLNKYRPEDIKKIIKNYKEALFNKYQVTDVDYEIIAKNSRGIPREAIGLLLKQIVTKDIHKVLRQSKIILDGLTEIDVKILKLLSQNDKPMGASYLSQVACIPQSDYEAIYERFLVEQGLVMRLSRGRTITEQGKALLTKINLGIQNDK